MNLKKANNLPVIDIPDIKEPDGFAESLTLRVQKTNAFGILKANQILSEKIQTLDVNKRMRLIDGSKEHIHEDKFYELFTNQIKKDINATETEEDLLTPYEIDEMFKFSLYYMLAPDFFNKLPKNMFQDIETDEYYTFPRYASDIKSINMLFEAVIKDNQTFILQTNDGSQIFTLEQVIEDNQTNSQRIKSSWYITRKMQS